MVNYYNIIKKPLITEKSNILKEQGNNVIFEVDRFATKPKIKEAVEKIFNVKVLEIKTIIVAGKSKRIGRRLKKYQSWKKAIIKLKQGNKIEFFEGV